MLVLLQYMQKASWCALTKTGFMENSLQFRLTTPLLPFTQTASWSELIKEPSSCLSAIMDNSKISYGPGWYELESGSAQYSFTELEELVSHYSETAISRALNFTLGAVCMKIGKEFPHYEIISDLPQSNRGAISKVASHFSYNIYSKGEPADLVKYKCYHRLMSRDTAEVTLFNQKGDSFLVRHYNDKLVLSKRERGYRFHTIIQRSPKGYQLEGDGKLFPTVPDLIAFYQNSLGTPAETMPTGLLEQISPSDLRTIFRKETTTLQVSWKRCDDLPVAFSAPHMVKIGEDVYVGGGMTAKGVAMSDIVFKYNIGENIWSPLPSCGTRYHGLTTLNSELIAVGGKVHGKAVNVVRTFRDGEWKKVLPPMPTPRCHLSTVSHANKIIIAAGGSTLMKRNGETVSTDVVEIYITDKQAWYSTKRLPFEISALTTCLNGDTCYTLGGTSLTDRAHTTLYTTIASLLENAVHGNSRCLVARKKIQDHPLIYSTPVELAGRLVAVGGSAELRLRRGTRFVSIYDFSTDTWVECKGAALPAPLYRPGVLKLDDSRVMIVGGQPKMQQFSAAVYIGNFKMVDPFSCLQTV